MALQPPQSTKIDRQTTTPFLLKLFYRSGGFHRLDEFSTTSSPLPSHLQIYTWPTCTLRELTHLLTTALPSLLPSPAVGTRVAYKLVFPDTRSVTTSPSAPGRYLSKELGNIVVGASSTNNGAANGDIALGTLEGEADRTLQDARFVIGDYIDCAVLPPLANGAVAPPPAYSGAPLRGGYGGSGVPPRSGFGGPRDNVAYGDGGFRVRGGGRGSFSIRSVMSSGGGNTPSASSETTAVLAVVQSLLDAIPSKNATKLLANCHPSGCCARMRGMDIQFGTIKDLADSIASLPGEVEDRFIDPEVKGTGT